MSLHTNLASLSKKPAAIATMAILGDYALGMSGNGKISPTMSIKLRKCLQSVAPCVECQQRGSTTTPYFLRSGDNAINFSSRLKPGKCARGGHPVCFAPPMVASLADDDSQTGF
jgi:hypothetical protein